MEATLRNLIQQALTGTFGITDVAFVVEHPRELAHGDYATNAAMAVAKSLGKNPREVADTLVAQLQASGSDIITEVSVAGPGFINMTLARNVLSTEVASAIAPSYGHNAV